MKRRKGLNRVSPRKVAYDEELAAITPAVLARAGHFCEIGRCNGPLGIHHRLRRSQGGQNTMENLMALCNRCHQLVHENPSWSYENGYLLKRGLVDTLPTMAALMDMAFPAKEEK